MPDPRPRSHRIAPVLILLAASASLASFSHGQGVPATDPLLRLKAGNERFVRAVADHAPVTLPSTPIEGAPTAAVLSCADQRMSPEVIFTAAPGELFVVRSLGEVADRAVVASIEHSVETEHVPLVVVLGHDSCAVVKTATDSRATALSVHIDYLLKAIRAGLPRSGPDQPDVRRAVLANVEQVINDVLGASPSLRTAVQGGRLTVVGAYFDAATGQVVFSEPVGLTITGWH